MLLAVDTATKSIGIALHDGAQLLAESVWSGKGYHTVELAPEIALMLRRVGRSAKDLTAVAVALGPGSYTGLRIGMAVAKGLALANQLELVGIPTHDILAWGQPKRSEPMLAVIRTGRCRIAVMWYKWKKSAWRPEGEILGITWQEALELLNKPTYICGELEPVDREMLRNQPQVILAPPALCVRRPGILAELAWQCIRAGKVVDTANIVPIYLNTMSGKTV